MNERGQARRLGGSVHGWTIFAHLSFLDQLQALAQQVEVLKKKDPLGYDQKNASKRLAAISKLAFDVIPQDPGRPEMSAWRALAIPVRPALAATMGHEPTALRQ
ncbi:type II toxin-antitoxin system YhaV family toxin [Verminephrobacter eiseniae]|uniref:type II toxin-antitoxin system YhaV family toxin n=1 Tax=Verminephrobacter eiseniae TaxID=364317 RepID=UPI0038B37EFB